MTPWLGTPTAEASGYIRAQRTVRASPDGPYPPQSQSFTVELSSPPTYWMGLLTCSSSGSRTGKTDTPDMGPRVTACLPQPESVHEPAAYWERERRRAGAQGDDRGAEGAVPAQGAAVLRRRRRAAAHRPRPDQLPAEHRPHHARAARRAGGRPGPRRGVGVVLDHCPPHE